MHACQCCAWMDGHIYKCPELRCSTALADPRRRTPLANPGKFTAVASILSTYKRTEAPTLFPLPLFSTSPPESSRAPSPTAPHPLAIPPRPLTPPQRWSVAPASNSCPAAVANRSQATSATVSNTANVSPHDSSSSIGTTDSVCSYSSMPPSTRKALLWPSTFGLTVPVAFAQSPRFVYFSLQRRSRFCLTRQSAFCTSAGTCVPQQPTAQAAA